MEIKVFILLYIFLVKECVLIDANHFRNRTRRAESSSCVGLRDDQICDGKKDCGDGSDETEATCLDVSCPPFAYKCKYGACINEDLVCDGKSDCVDNSDETAPRCGNKVGSNLCKEDEFRCKSGQCIPESNGCDGVVHCNDRSDETSELCKQMICASFNFRCNYGACINEDLKCNGNADCVDGSDEYNCGSNIPITQTTLKPTTTKPTTATSVSLGAGSCILPSHPTNGQWNIVGGAYGSPGQSVPEGATLYFTCNEGYSIDTLNGKQYSLCIRGQFKFQPKCVATCPSLYKTDVLKITCTREAFNASCENPVDDTIAEVKCVDLYTDPKNIRYIYCQNGKWSDELPRCVPECGLLSGTAEQLILDGQDAEYGEYPWQAALFRDKENVCGGAMVHPRIIVTAAHCISTTNVSRFEIGVGKYYRDYRHSKDKEAQYSEVEEIFVHYAYLGTAGNLKNDIAVVLVKNPFKITKFVLPVCLKDLFTEQSQNIWFGLEGLVSGWGHTGASGNPSPVLKYLKAQYRSQEECEVPKEYKAYYLPFVEDKFCAGTPSGVGTPCRGDSGGGLVFPSKKNNDNIKRYFLVGIVSVAFPQGNRECDNRKNALYTYVYEHRVWLNKIILKYK